MIWFTIVSILILVVLIIISLISVLLTNETIVEQPLLLFDNNSVPLIEPPTEIFVEGNTHECHKNLTPCNTHMDCDICKEGLANCQYFNDTTIVTMHDEYGNEKEYTILPGESYCMALNRERARSCNPNTGIWILAESDVGFSLLCSCLTPGLVTQMNMYEDCNVTVGCQPNGRIADLNESPMRCLCDEGYVSDYDNETQTPYCRPLAIRDIVYDESFFPRAPCEDGFVRLDHPALDDTYRRELRLPDICVVDPCSVDPISGQRTSGRLMYYKNDDENIEYKYCNCPLWDNLFSVYSDAPSMIGESSANVSNACIRPFNVNIFQLARLDYKFFWAQNDTTRSDDEIVAVLRMQELSDERYRRVAYSFLSGHPEVWNTVGFVLVKFSTAYSPRHLSDSFLDYYHQNLFQRYIITAAKTSAPCLFPGEGRCITANHQDCIRRHASGQVWTAETFTGSWCILSREGDNLRIWSPATRYPHGEYPVALRVNALFGLSWNNRDYTTVKLVHGGVTTSGGNNVDNLAVLLNTYRNYSIN
ncbi:per os infectivity factor 1 [Apocheima cinerarium nucleopolyhedrovirus]|uniref:per os infectivity factor 1 n=1 Tax=Apocheima cinerarium nucleopolyhedrovirus TaxID=307461 RepID=UPI0001D92049|nr:per os infectivity factor 1 [Apocheima cinerarium nucleopolyhedrovirus]ADB84381.1 per os infectivity factor 1 [Apocheima cinerarium nucleopolyhedrovirus]